MRSWMRAISALGSVVMMVKERTSPSGPAQLSHSPANDSSPPLLGLIKYGCLPPSWIFHS